MKYRYSIDKWNEAKEEMNEILVGIAKDQSIITYSDLAIRLNTIKFRPNGLDFHAMLGEISIEEDENERGMLTVVVVTKKNQRPGKGFFTLADDLGRNVYDKSDFFASELGYVHTYWGNK